MQTRLTLTDGQTDEHTYRLKQTDGQTNVQTETNSKPDLRGDESKKHSSSKMLNNEQMQEKIFISRQLKRPE